MMPGQRKFRLSSRKNYERKKYQSRLIISIPQLFYDNHDKARKPEPTLELLVSIPLSIYLDLNVSDPNRLFQMVARLKILPMGWSLENDHSNQLIVISKSFSHSKRSITIDSDCKWSIAINETCICLPSGSLLKFCKDKITTITTFLQLLQNIENSKLCIGNPDNKFCQIRDLRNGKFVDQSREYQT